MTDAEQEARATVQPLKRTALAERHAALGARMTPFAGWLMPVQYSSILEEVAAVRSRTGVFDISHMGRVLVRGGEAASFLQYVTTNDIGILQPGRAQYSLIPNPAGGIKDDIIVYRLAPDVFLVVLNASNTAKDLEWLQGHAGQSVEFEDRTTQTAMLAVQGPEAPALVASVWGEDLLQVSRFGFAARSVGHAEILFCRTGYTGEDGFELIVPAEYAASIWEELLGKGAVPCGLGARDVLRIEAGYPLYGHELDEDVSPVEAGLMWVVKLNKGAFIGRERIEEIKHGEPRRRLMGLHVHHRIVPRQGYTLFLEDGPAGIVTSGAFSPTVGHSIGMAYVDHPYDRLGTVVEIEVRGQRIPATLVPKKELIPTGGAAAA
ncbi:MAG: glycine cleavage system aminomethyltransferase GcvT [Chthonomonadales bacterium]